MFTQPTGPRLHDEQARDLDDDFFGSRPMEYFHSRIDGLLDGSPARDAMPSQARQAFEKALGGMPGLLRHTGRDRELQVAVDAFSVRHHSAEALVRLYHALTTAGPDGPRCVWAAMVGGPPRTTSLVDAVREQLSSDGGAQTFAALVLPARIPLGEEAQAAAALGVAYAWLQRAMNLLVSGDLDLNAANNKVKHGLAVRARDDQRVAFIRTPPSAEGTVPLSAFSADDALDIFTGLTMRFLSRPPTSKGQASHLESTTFQLVPHLLLAEAAMLSTTFGILFHHAARDHLRRHPLPADGEPGQPGRHAPALSELPPMPLGPTPAELLGNAMVGLRHPVTTRSDGSRPRGAALVFERGVYPLDVDISGRRDAVIVDG